MAWTDERIAKLKQGWEGGMTATQIAEMLGEGVTRNAVIGKAHRLGLESRPSPVKATDATPAPARAAAAAPPPPPAAAAPPPAPAPVAASAPAITPMEAPAARPVAKPATGVSKGGKHTRTSLLELNEKVCKWPIGHPGDADFHFCGRPSNAGVPSCNDHCLVAYQAQMPRKDRPRQLPPLPGAPRR
jgi:GcrA cell cycle regulator